MSNNSQMTLFQHETTAGPGRALAALMNDNALGEGIRSSYAILSIKASRWRIKYKKNETPLQAMNQQTQRAEPIPSLEMVIVKANSFLNKQYYKGKYVEGNSSPPDCYSLDGKVPSAQIEHPVHSNCAMCPMNQFGSLIGDNGVKQKACRDTKKLAVVPLADLRNETWGGPMLFRVPPSALGDLSKLADAMKARGFPYNAVAVRFSFDIDASHPKPQFNAIRPLTDAEAEVVAELYLSDAVAAVLADNDVVVDAHVAPQREVGGFEQEPQVPVGAQPQQQPAPMAPVGQPAPSFTAPAAAAAPAPAAFAPPPPAAPIAEQTGPTAFAPAFTPPPPPAGMHGAVVQAFVPGAQPPDANATLAAFAAQAPAQQPAQDPAPQAASPFGQPAATAPVAAKKPRTPKPVVQTAAEPVAIEPSAPPAQGQLDDDINGILAGLSAFTGGK